VANTAYLRREVEGFVRGELAGRYGQGFSSQTLRLRTGGQHEFDCVSGDGSIIASVKSASGRTARGKNPSGKIKDCLAELYYLSLVDAPIRILVLTTPAFHDIFLKATRGAIAEGVTIECMPLPGAMQLEVDKIVNAASAEVSPQFARQAVLTEVESGDLVDP
jgi:hypothetical protein